MKHAPWQRLLLGGALLALAACNSAPADSLTLPPPPPPPVIPPPAPPLLVLAVNPSSRRATAPPGTSAPSDSAAVSLSGTNAAATQWSATHLHPWITLLASSGTGSGTATWMRNTAGLAAGTYVDTITITAPGAAGSPVTVIDTLQLTLALVPLVLNVSPRSRRASAVQGTGAPGDNIAITLSGDGAANATWSITKRAAWAAFTPSVGTGSGSASWARNALGLAAGTYVDTITVTATGALNSPAAVFDTLVITPVAGGGPDLGLNADLHGRMLFPASNLWNRPVDTAQVDPASALILGTIGLGVSLHPDFGASYNGGPFGIPYIVVPDGIPRVSVPFTYASESDPGPYPIPANPPIEPGGGDSHLLVVTQNEWKLYELYALFSNGNGGWTAGSGAIWNLATGAPRPIGWTSADAAGLPIL
ncbi:MAG: BACON domain-containing protein, partial [Gemmatimonadales bacterium]